MTGAPETHEGLNPSERLGIERDQGHEGSARCAPRKEEQLCRYPTVADGMKSLGTLVLFANLNGRCQRFAGQEIWRGHEGHHRGVGER